MAQPWHALVNSGEFTHRAQVDDLCGGDRIRI